MYLKWQVYRQILVRMAYLASSMPKTFLKQYPQDTESSYNLTILTKKEKQLEKYF